MSTDSARATEKIVANRTAAVEEFDKAVHERFMEAADAAGLLHDGTLDDELLTERIFQELRTKHVVSIDPDSDDRRDSATSSTKDELTAAIFTAGPTVLDAEKNAIEAGAFAKCQSAVWNPTQTGKRGRVQKLLEPDRLVLVRGKVFRDTNLIKEGIYVSTHQEIILREFWGPRLDKVTKLAASLLDDFEMVRDRVPGLEDPMRAAIEAAFVEATAKLPIPTLGSGAANGRKSLGE